MENLSASATRTQDLAVISNRDDVGEFWPAGEGSDAESDEFCTWSAGEVSDIDPCEYLAVGGERGAGHTVVFGDGDLGDCGDGEVHEVGFFFGEGHYFVW